MSDEKFVFDKYKGPLGDFYRKKDAEKLAAQSAAAATAEPTMAPAVSKVVDPTTGHPPQFPTNRKPAEQPEPVTVVMQSRSAKLLTDADEPADEIASPIEETAEVAASTDEFTPEELAKLAEYGDDPAKIKKALIHAQRMIGKKGTEAAGLEQMVKDVLAAQAQAAPAPAVAQPSPSIDVDKIKKEIGANFLDDIEGNIGKLLETAVQIVESKQDAKRATESKAKTEKRIKELTTGDGKYAGMVTKDNAAYLDAVAIAVSGSMPAGSTDADVYEKALETYAKETKWQKGQPAVNETAEMRAAAALTPAAATPPKSPKQTYTKAQLDKLLTQNPIEYARQYKELMKAYAEGRVKR